MGSSSESAPGLARTLPDEDAVLDRAVAGDAGAFRVLVEVYRDRAYGLALRIVGSPEEAEEVAQDAFVRAWRALPRFRRDARFATWLYRIVTRCAFDASAALRARRQRETGLEVAESAAAFPGRATGVDPGGERRRLERLIGTLPEVQRAVVTLFYYEDRAVVEVACILDLPEGTVKTHLYRARAALRRAWEREAKAEGSDDLLGP
jgi:RNA polymerase sigma-70 factor (ECF subfamily)